MSRGDEADEVLRLRERLWRSRRKRSRYGGVALLVIGFLSLPLALITHDLIFEITFLLTIPAGLLVVLISAETYVRAGTANAIIMSLLFDFKELSNEFFAEDRPLFVPTGERENKVQVYFGNPSLSESVSLPELARPLTRIYELEMGDLSKLELQYLSRNLPKVIVDGLQLAEAVRIDVKGDEVSTTVDRPVFWPLYIEEGLEPMYEKIGCPLAWSVGESLAKSSGRVVKYMGYECSKAERLLRYRFMLGPKVASRSGLS